MIKILMMMILIMIKKVNKMKTMKKNFKKMMNMIKIMKINNLMIIKNIKIIMIILMMILINNKKMIAICQIYLIWEVIIRKIQIIIKNKINRFKRKILKITNILVKNKKIIIAFIQNKGKIALILNKIAIIIITIVLVQSNKKKIN